MSYQKEQKLILSLCILAFAFAKVGVEVLLWDWHVVGAARALFNYTVSEITYWQAFAIALPVRAFQYRGHTDPEPTPEGSAHALARAILAYSLMLLIGWVLSGVWS